MKIFISLVLTLAVLSVSTNAAATWQSLFKFPFTASPLQLMLGISCPSQNACFIAGANTNTAFGIYKTGSLPGNFSNITKLTINSPEPPLLLMAVAMQDEKVGVCGGLELGIGGTYYTKDGNTFTESLNLGIVTTQAVYSLGNNSFTFVGQENRNQGAAISTDGGATFTGDWWPSNFSADAPPRYGAFPSAKVWYVSGGTWPQQNVSNSEDYVEISSKLRLNKKTKRYELTQFRAGYGTDLTGNFTAVIAKSTDGGKTWTVQYHDVGNWYFNEISCASETVCMAAAEGEASQGGKDGCHVFGTTNGGANWTEIYTYGADKQGSCLAVEMLSETEAWVGTTHAESQLKAGAEFSHTVDGGKTWTTGTSLREVVVITQMSFIDNTHAYGVAVTALEISTAVMLSPSSSDDPLLQVEEVLEGERRFLDH